MLRSSAHCRAFSAALPTASTAWSTYPSIGFCSWVERSGSGLSISYLDFGKWTPVPEEYKLADEVVALLELVMNKDRNQYELVVSCEGLVSVDEDRELLLIPPDSDTA